ncbi:universal stress protein [Serratia plymuthica]|uniref:Universal stress protein n=2 Tax=Serratia plymuthica TaxID=82996 RepID=A0A318PHI7_SERPL|nr:universal stress protein [Serratia plymuthica]AGO54851.1 universal stress protein A [Serratia plymuthica 4Rx13]AGP44148.1 universal stress protein UspA [Serratia plymuthica S13]AHY07077.1 universal stress protein UspA [Serratia plymuthica]ANJ91551.1 universal stress protein UspA [Serratia plymuthica]ANJ98286.1 universal stress protein UspA [Serratia plymuthica]
MAYQHIVVATDLSEDAEFLLGKGARLAAALNAKLSLIYIDIHRTGYYAELGVGEYNYTDRTFSERVKNMLNAIRGQSSYPVEEVIVSRGELTQELNRAAKDKGFDLVIFGHHHDVWSRLVSSARQAINDLNVDLLVIPIDKK